jgi:hypothetical protein
LKVELRTVIFIEELSKLIVECQTLLNVNVEFSIRSYPEITERQLLPKNPKKVEFRMYDE